MNTTDGGLHFQAGIDWSIWDKDIQKIRNDVQASMKFAYEQSGLLDDSFAKISGGAANIEKVLEKAGISFEQLISGNMLENLKAANLEFGKTGAELRQAAKDADSFVTGMEEGLKQVIEQQQAVLEQITQMPAGDAKNSALAEFAATTEEIQRSTEIIQQFREFVNDVKEDAKSLSQKFSEAREEMERLAISGKANTERYKELQAEAERLKKIQKDVNSEINKSFEAPKELTLSQQISEATRDLEKMRVANQENTQQYKDMQAEVIRLKTIQKSVADEIKTAMTPPKELSVEQQLQKAQEEMRKMVLSGDNVTEKYKELAAEATRLKSAQEQVNKEIQAMTKPQGLEGLISGMTFLTATLGLAQGAVSMFGVENDRLNQIMLRLQSLMSVTIGLQELQKQVSAEGAFQINVLSKAKEIWAAVNGRLAIALGGSTAAATAFMIAITGGLAAAVLGIIYLFDRYEQKVKLQADLNKKMADSVAEPILAYKKLQAQWNALGNDLEDKKKFITQNKEAFKELGYSVNGVSAAENLFVKNSTAVMAAMMMRARAAAAMQLATEEYKKALNAQMQDEQEKRILKSGTGGEKFVVRSKQNARLIAGSSLADQAKEGFANANSLVSKSAQYAKSEADFIKKTGVPAFEDLAKSKEKAANAPTKSKTKDQLAEEILPKGSVAEIQKRLQAIDQALSKATGKDQIEALKQKRIETAKELAEAEKAILIRAFGEQMEYARKSIELRDKMFQQGYSKEQVDKLFPEIKDKTYLQILEDTANSLKNISTVDAAKNLQKINEELDRMNNIQSKVDLANASIENITNKFSGAKLLEQLTKSHSAALKDATEQEAVLINKAYEDATKNAVKAQQDKFNALLKEQQTYQEKSDALTREWEEMRAMAGTDAEREKINKLFSNRQGKLDMEMIQETAEWQVAFSELEGMSETSLQAILSRLLEFQEKSKGTLTLSDAAELQKAIDNVNRAANKNPFAKLSSTFANYRTSLKAAKKAQDDYNQAQEEFGKGSKEAVAAAEKAIEADKKSLDAKKALIGQLQEGQNIFNAVGEGVMELTDAFGGMDDATKDAIGNIMAIGNAAFDLGVSIASGNIAGMISAGIKLIASIGKALSGDQKKERSIKRQAAAVKELETAYNNLAFAAERAFGAAKYDGQRDLIRNLEQQKIAIEAMMRTESSKKKADKSKIADYKAQITQINQSITELKEGIISDVLQTEIPDMAAKIGDALLDAFGKGEDGINAINDAFNDMVRNIMRNQLNKMLEAQMKPVYDSLLKASGLNADGTGTFDGFTEAELKDVREQYLNASKIGQEFIKGYSEIFKDLQSPEVQGIKGDIKGVTEKTAGALEAQLNALRVNQVSGLEVMRNSLLNLVRIEENTRRLHNIDKNIQELNAKTKNNLAGVG